MGKEHECSRLEERKPPSLARARRRSVRDFSSSVSLNFDLVPLQDPMAKRKASEREDMSNEAELEAAQDALEEATEPQEATLPDGTVIKLPQVRPPFRQMDQ